MNCTGPRDDEFNVCTYFQGPLTAPADCGCADQRGLREAIPENRLRVYGPRPPGAWRRPAHFPQRIHFVRRVCAGARGAYQPKKRRVPARADVRKLIGNLVDIDSMLELRPFFGLAMVTCPARIEGRPIGIVANNCMHLSGAVRPYVLNRNDDALE